MSSYVDTSLKPLCVSIAVNFFTISSGLIPNSLAIKQKQD